MELDVSKWIESTEAVARIGDYLGASVLPQ